jgi:hypothetical protein
MAGLRVDSNGLYFFRYILINLLHYWAGVSMAWFCVAVSRQFPVSSLIANSFVSFLSLTCGFLIAVDSLPAYVSWIRYISTYWYSYRGLSSGEMTDRVFGCPFPSPNSPECLPYTGNFFLETQKSKPNDFAEPIWRITLIWTVNAFFVLLLLQLWHPRSGQVYQSQNPSKSSKSKQSTGEFANKSALEGQKKGECWSLKLSQLQMTLCQRTWSGSANQIPILRLIDADFPSGQLSIILGGSGAGKVREDLPMFEFVYCLEFLIELDRGTIARRLR